MFTPLLRQSSVRSRAPSKVPSRTPIGQSLCRQVAPHVLAQKFIALVLVAFLFPAVRQPPAAAADWPQILGPTRDGHVAGTLELKGPWEPQSTPAWRIPLGSGFAGPAVADGKVIVFHRQQDREIVAAHRITDGVEVWRQSWPAAYQGRIDPDEGPRCVPLLHLGRVYCHGAAGDVACVSLDDGKLLWKRELRRELKADDGYFGAGSTPVVSGGYLVVCVGAKNASVVALDLESGKTVWQCGTEEASYASPIVVGGADAGGERLLAVMRLQTYWIDPATGKILGQVAFGSRGPTVNAATPVNIGGDDYLLTASYGVGTLVVSARDNSLKEVSRGKQLASQYNTPVVLGNRIVGIDGREDVGVASLKVLERDSQKIVWERNNFGTAHLMAIAADRVLVLNNEGQVVLIDAAADGYQPILETMLPSGTYRGLPALAGNKLLARRTQSPQKSELVCVELR